MAVVMAVLVFLCGVVLQGTYGQGQVTVTIMRSPGGTPVDGEDDTFDYPILSNVTLTCIATPSPSNSVTYRWNTGRCYANNRNERRCFPASQTTQSVTGIHLLAEDAGTITCTVTIGGVGTHTSGPLTLRISGITMTGASDISTDLVSSNQITDYSYVTHPLTLDPFNVSLRCATGLGPGTRSNTVLGGWSLNGNPIIIPTGDPVCGYGVLEVRGANGRSYPGVVNLYLCGTFTTTEEGVYSCIMMNSAMMDQTMRVGVYFSGRTAPVIDPPMSPVRIAIGMGVTLPCTSRGSPPDTFTLRKDSGSSTPTPSVIPVDYTSTTAVFQISYTINSVTASDAGTYTCTVSNPMGDDSQTISVIIAAGPPTGVRTTMLMTTSVVVMWDQSPSSEVTGYLVSYSTDASYISQSNRMKSAMASSRSTTSVTLTNLEEDTLYAISVQSSSSNDGLSASSDEVSIRTLTAVPSSPPQNVMVTSVETASLRVSWQPPPPIDHNGEITGYVIEYSIAGTSNMMSETVTSGTPHTISGLVPFVEYSVTVSAMTSSGTGLASNPIMQTSGQDRPSLPRSLMVNSVTDTRVTLSWRTPDPTNGMITQYQLQYRRCAGGSSFTLQPLNSEVTRTVTELTHNTEYCFRVRAYTVISLGPSGWTDEVMGRTYGPPTNVDAVTLSPRSIEVTWDSPVANVNDVTGYIISYNAVEAFANDGNMSVSTSPTRVTINDLEEFVNYDITVQAVYNTINVPTTNTVSVMIWSDVPDGSPREITLMDTDPAMLSVTYRPPEAILRNGAVTGYVIRYIRVDGGVSQMMNFSDNNSNGFRTSVIPGLVAFTSYSVEIAAVNVNGTGPFSDSVMGLSGQNRPATAPRSLTAIDIQPRSVTLSWIAPDTPNGIIIQYEVQYSGNSTTSLVNFTDILMGTVEGLSPGTIYTLQIRAYTRVGAGPISNNITIMTLPPPPEPVTGVTIPVQSISSSMLTINWIKPDVPNGNITYYTVFYLPVSGPYGPIMTSNRRKRQLAQDGEFAMNFTGTSGTLTNLNGSVTYKIQVSAIALYNGIELVGNRSSAVMITTMQGVPSAPQSLVGECMTNTSIFLLWERPDPPNGRIISYTILYTFELHDGVDLVTNSTNIPAATFYYLLTDLRPDTQYQVSVMASTSVGLGAAAELSVMTSSNNLPHTISTTCNSTACDNDSGGAIAGFTAALVVALVVVVISVVLNVILFTQLRKRTSYTPPKHSEQVYHEMKRVTQKLPEPTYDLIDSGQKSHDDIKMTTNAAYDISTTVKMEDNPAYSLSGSKAVESDYM